MHILSSIHSPLVNICSLERLFVNLTILFAYNFYLACTFDIMSSSRDKNAKGKMNRRKSTISLTILKQQVSVVNFSDSHENTDHGRPEKSTSSKRERSGDSEILHSQFQTLS